MAVKRQGTSYSPMEAVIPECFSNGKYFSLIPIKLCFHKLSLVLSKSVRLWGERSQKRWLRQNNGRSEN